ncbi:bifunctional nicotinamidase/pyrazinamidase [Roseomonas marmotae]|uniref:nicotinamidase n=1 Tax=Roseomonas marmotae TaxID=2768161 RepID=A0ABS3KH25_9PROT|nr:bifunctional nicotinamidase/pyrazinamidase [Roseomonas marmotae]MBO1075636.1 bifunctional nicotinamidase/pyrazinamidase [Roseomonas marmotae]QTI79497.1 bifunctional nicotinamidase/pyrazinamidase [Roseomonas marmotae]
MNPTDLLLVTDVQPDFMPGGALPAPDGDAVVPVINRLLTRFDHAVATQDWHPADHASFASQHAGRKPFESVMLSYGEQVLWPDHCVQGTPGAALHPALDTRRIELVIRKGFRKSIDSYSAFRENDRSTNTGLHGYLRERGFKRIFVCGLARGYCTDFSAEDAADLGYEVVLIEDACRGITPEATAAGTARLLAKGVRILASDAL